eukprot:356408-Chlamydomonas_euryale.AAC.5
MKLKAGAKADTWPVNTGRGLTWGGLEGGRSTLLRLRLLVCACNTIWSIEMAKCWAASSRPGWPCLGGPARVNATPLRTPQLMHACDDFQFVRYLSRQEEVSYGFQGDL